jgi:ppGpp synthetase/RelA/SpoT-type nucleotidyltranferase
VHSPELASVVEKLLDDPHPLNVTASLRNPALREQVLSTVEELGRGEAFHAYDGDWQRLQAESPGRGPLFEPTPPPVNHVTIDGRQVPRLQSYVDAAKLTDPALRVGRDPTPEQLGHVADLARRLERDVKPAVNQEIAGIADALRQEYGGHVEVNSRAKDAAGLLDKVERMTRGRSGAPGRSGYQVGDVIDAVGARVTVGDMATLERVYSRIVDHYGVGDRILESDNMYAAPKAKNPDYRVISVVVGIEVGGRPYAFELQLTTLRASVAADIEHNAIYKPYIPISDAEQLAVREAMREAAALDQLETRHE